MPYIKPASRVIAEPLEQIPFQLLEPGEVTYLITRIIREYVGDTYNYSLLSEAIGILECAKLELYRRMVAPYEDSKMEENGDVY